jgi:hypothetical protein
MLMRATNSSTSALSAAATGTILLLLIVRCCDSSSTRRHAPPPSIVADCATSPTTALHAAVAAARKQQRAGGGGATATVQIEGTCRLSRPIALSAADSGTRWVGSPTGATISGGIALDDTGWRMQGQAACAGCGSIWAYTLPAGTGPSRQLYLDNVRANRTVMPFPHDGAYKSAAGVHSPLAGKLSSPSVWQDGRGIELIHRGTHTCNYSSSIQWAETRVPVESTTASGLFKMVEPAYQHSNNNRNLLPCFLENALELVGHPKFGRPGDYFLNHSHLYVVSPRAPTNAVLPQSVGLLVLSNVSDFEVSGVELTEATWQLDVNGYMQAQAGTYVRGPACGSYNASDPAGSNHSAGHPCPNSGFDRWAVTPAGVAVHGGHRVRFRNCTFSRLGATGLAFDRGSQNCSVEASLLEDISGNGVQIGTIDTYNISDPSAQDADNAVVDSVVRHVGREWLGTCGIIAFYSRGTRVIHNEVSNVPYTGISIGW